MLILLITLPFVYLSYADMNLSAICDGTMLLLVAIHLGYQVRVGMKPIDAFAWNEECQFGKVKIQILIVVLMYVAFLESMLNFSKDLDIDI